MNAQLAKSAIGQRGAEPPPTLSDDVIFAKFAIGQVVRHRIYPFRGVIFDVDPSFNNSEEWWLSIPDNVSPRKDQPFYHLLAENEESSYVAYVSEQNLIPDDTGQPVGHPQASLIFESFDGTDYKLRPRISH
jgi:heat shock protein HspQ